MRGQLAHNRERTAWRPSAKTAVACAYSILLSGKGEIKSLPTWSALTESPERADDSSPGSASLRAQPWVKSHKIPAADSEAARSAKFICGSPIRPISRIRPIPPHRKSTFAHPKSTVDLGCEPLIGAENDRRTHLSSKSRSNAPKSGPKIKEFNRNQTVTDRNILSPGRCAYGRPHGLLRRSLLHLNLPAGPNP